MKKILMLIFLISTLFAYEGCGTDKKEALNNLAQSIYVEVSNNFQKESNYFKNNFFDLFSKNIKTSTTQSSNVILKNVKFFKKDNLICATISKENLLKSALAAKKDILNFKMRDLPNDFELKIKKAKEINNKITFVKAVLGDKLNSYELRRFGYLKKRMQDILNKGEVVFDSNIPNAKITISGIDEEISPSKPILLNAGTYSYEAKVYGKCPASGSFSVEKGKIKHIKVELGDFPQIIIKSNVNAIAKIDNRPIPLNAPYTIKKCSGAAIYKISYDNDTETGTINLEPNLKKTITTNFLTAKEKKALNETKKVYEKARGVEISYGYALSDKKRWDQDKRITIRGFRNYGIYQLGFGLSVGTQKRFIAKDINEGEIFGSFRVQIPEFKDTPLRIKAFLFVPYVGVDFGFDMLKYFKDGFKKASWRGSNITTITRGNVGFNIMFHKQLGIDIKYSHDYMEKKDNILSAGIVMQY